VIRVTKPPTVTISQPYSILKPTGGDRGFWIDPNYLRLDAPAVTNPQRQVPDGEVFSRRIFHYENQKIYAAKSQ
jgi:hypothetical protein